jgi:hypothetical protein
MSKPVNYKEFNPSYVNSLPPVPRDIPGQKTKYFTIQLKYEDPTHQGSMNNGGILMEWPEVHSRRGIQFKKNEQSGKDEYSIYCDLPSIGETQNLVTVIHSLHKRCCELFDKDKGRAMMPRFNKDDPSIFSVPIYLWKDASSPSGYKEGSDPGFFFRVINRTVSSPTGKFLPFDVKTRFTRPKKREDGTYCVEEIPWSVIENSEISFIPVVNYKSLCVAGGKISFQHELHTALITDIKEISRSVDQTDTVNRVLTANPSRLDTLEDQIAKITLSRQNLMTSPKIPQSLQSESSPSQSSGLDSLMVGASSGTNRQNLLSNINSVVQSPSPTGSFLQMNGNNSPQQQSNYQNTPQSNFQAAHQQNYQNVQQQNHQNVQQQNYHNVQEEQSDPQGDYLMESGSEQPDQNDAHESLVQMQPSAPQLSTLPVSIPQLKPAGMPQFAGKLPFSLNTMKPRQ